jgi:hypothetical protein
MIYDKKVIILGENCSQKRKKYMKKKNYFSGVLAVAGILIASGAAYSGTAGRPPMTVPTLGEWGMIGTAVLLGIAGLYRILKYK